MTSIIKVAQYIDTINRLFGVMKLQSKVEAFQEDDIFYAEFNPFIVVADQHMDVLTNPSNALHSATVMMGFNVTKPNDPVMATSFKLNGQSMPFGLSVTFNEFVEKLGYASTKLSTAMLTQMAVSATTQTAPVVATKEVLPADNQYQVKLIRDYKLNPQKMLIVPKDTGGAVVLAHFEELANDELKVYIKFSLCSRDDKFSVQEGKRIAKEAEPIVFIANQMSCFDVIMENALKVAIFNSVEQKSQFKRVLKLMRKQNKLNA